MFTLSVEVPAKLEPLLRPARYKGAHGGRGGAKSHFFAEQAVLKNYMTAAKGVCIREVQDSIKDSVKALIEQKISKLGLEQFYEVLDTEIRGKNGSLMIFRGMQSYNAANIKSLEGFDWAWVEEAQTLSDVSWRMLRPTIRKEGSEIWCGWNPRYDSDAVDKFFRGPAKALDSVCVEVNWADNPWFPEVLRREKDADYITSPEMADHVWGGHYEIVSEGAYYAKAIVQAEREGRVGIFPYDPRLPVKTAWDIGVDDYTAVWFMQDDGVRCTAIDYYETSNEGASDIVAAALPELFRAPPFDEKFLGWDRDTALKALERPQGYTYGEHYLPHDVKMREWGAGARSRVETLKSLGLATVRKGAAQGPEERVNAVRRILPVTRFNNTERVQNGIKRLRRYRRKWNDNLGTYTTPEHDENSHGCLVAGSMVRMADGSHKAIETVKAGDYVWTPTENCLIVWAGFVKMSDAINDIETECGKHLKCTAEHKILTTQGFLEAGSLSPSMVILTGQEWQCHLIGLLSRVTGIGFRALITGEHPTAGTISTGLFGQGYLAQYQMATTSTTKTGKRLTTRPLIWNALRSTITLARIPLSWLDQVLLSRQVLSHGSAQPSGTNLMLAVNGTPSTGEKRGSAVSVLKRFVQIAAKSISRLILRVPSSAHGSAKIRRVNALKGAQSVYDVTVERSGSYQANGLYVSNSDAFGEYAVNCRIRLAASTPKVVPINHVLEARPDGSIHSNMTVMEIIAARKRRREAD